MKGRCVLVVDVVSMLIADLHKMIGHDKTAMVLAGGIGVGMQDACLLCQWEKNPTPERKTAVIEAFDAAERKTDAHDS